MSQPAVSGVTIRHDEANKASNSREPAMNRAATFLPDRRSLLMTASSVAALAGIAAAMRPMRALGALSKNMVFISFSSNVGQAGRAGPFGSPEVAKLTQYELIRSDMATFSGVGVPPRPPRLRKT